MASNPSFNDTDEKFPHFVAWDTTNTRRIARSEARFQSEEEAIRFFKDKANDRTLFVWRGVLDDKKTDWMHVEWTSGAEKNDHPRAGYGYAWSTWTEQSFCPLTPKRNS